MVPLEIIFFGTKPIKQKLSMSPKHSSNLLHWCNAGSHGTLAPSTQKHSSPVRRDIIPEELEVFLQQITAYGFNPDYSRDLKNKRPQSAY
jgi:hypothetical protein